MPRTASGRPGRPGAPTSSARSSHGGSRGSGTAAAIPGPRPCPVTSSPAAPPSSRPRTPPRSPPDPPHPRCSTDPSPRTWARRPGAHTPPIALPHPRRHDPRPEYSSPNQPGQGPVLLRASISREVVAAQGPGQRVHTRLKRCRILGVSRNAHPAPRRLHTDAVRQALDLSQTVPHADLRRSHGPKCRSTAPDTGYRQEGATGAIGPPGALLSSRSYRVTLRRAARETTPRCGRRRRTEGDGREVMVRGWARWLKPRTQSE
ncbi:hypothetical protein BX257_8871 [Streptomyces sp. 3212.3]|nr:hypothetical protein BX257_8871 [Streptomyces sp. 3212.3]